MLVVLLLICVTSLSNLKTVFCMVSGHSLHPLELLNLIQKESGIKKSSIRHDPGISKELTQITTTLPSSTTDENNLDNPDGELSLKSRKVWSRWGKWGGCSVTCGEGMMTRRRLCVAGRCAPGELEEQRRPCCQTLCYTGLVLDELRDQD